MALDYLEPLGDNVYLEMDEREGVSKIIATPDAYRQRAEKGTVISIGPDVKGLKPGDRVVISFHTGIHIQLPETYVRPDKHRIVREFEILAKLKEK